jgi:phosphate transport system substrate-binding protein
MKIPRKIFKKEKNILNKWGKNWFIPVAAILVAAIALAGCSAPSSGPATPAKSINLTGAGATFPAPLYTKWFDEYNKLTGVKVNYQPIGSGGGISQITEGTVDFGASDGIMTEAQVAKAEQKGGPILHVPMTSGAVAVIYNLAGIGPGQLKLTGDVLADIYLKKITKWNDSAIASLNPDLKLPDAPIAVVFRSDGSGTTYIFTNYLSKISQDWSSRVGNATSVKWPGDIGGQGNAGVAGQVQQIPNSIGYVELAYAEQNKLAWAKLKNAAGNFIEPSPEATTRAAEGVSLPDDMKVMLTNSANPEAYPIVGFTWILVYVNQKDKDKGEALTKMLWWAIHDGQQFTGPLTYASLAAPAVLKAENAILSIKYQGQPLITR